MSDREKTRRMGDGSAHWPAVPPDPLHPDEPRRPQPTNGEKICNCEVSPPGSGCGTVGLVVTIAVLILGVACYMAMLARVGAR